MWGKKHFNAYITSYYVLNYSRIIAYFLHLIHRDSSWNIHNYPLQPRAEYISGERNRVGEVCREQ